MCVCCSLSVTAWESENQHMLLIRTSLLLPDDSTLLLFFFSPLLLPSLFLCHMLMQGESGSLAPHGGGVAPHTSPVPEIWSVCALIIRNNQTSWLGCFVFELLWLSAACCVVILLIIGLFIPIFFFNLLSLFIRLVIPNSFVIEINACCRVYLIAIHRVITLLHHYGYLRLKKAKLQRFDTKSKKRTSCQCGNCSIQTKTVQIIYNISLSCATNQMLHYWQVNNFICVTAS